MKRGPCRALKVVAMMNQQRAETARGFVAALLMFLLAISILAAPAQGSEATAKLIKAIHGPDQNARVSAFNELGDLAKHDPAIWTTLVGALSDDDLSVRSFAADQFSKASDTDAPILVPKLRALLKNKNSRIRLAAVQALQFMGPRAKDATADLAMMLKDSEADTRWQAADALGAIGPAAKGAVGDLEAALKDSDHGLRQEAAFALARIDPRDRAAIPALLEGLGPASVDEQRAIESLTAMGVYSRDALPTLEHLLTVGRNPGQSPDESTVDDSVRIEVAKMIGKVGGIEAVPSLSDALMHDNVVEVRSAALQSLRDLGDDGAGAIPAFIQALRDSDLLIRQGAVDALVKLGTHATPALIAALQNKDLYIREGAVETLSRTNPLPDDAVRALAVTASSDKSQTVREDAEDALQNARTNPLAAALGPVQKQAPAEPAPAPAEDTNRRCTREEIIATIPADDEHEYPLRLDTLLPVDSGRFLVTLHKGQDRGDRLAIWKTAGDDRYQRTQLMEANVDVDESISPPELFNPKGQPNGENTRFLYLVSGTRRFADETVFAVDTYAHELRPVEIEPPEKAYASMLKPGEQWTPYNVNYFTDDQVPRFKVTLAKKTDPDCCPTAGQIVGTYKIVEDVQPGSDPLKPPVRSWKFVPANATRKPMPPQ
jgi:HEAT repeat protein